MKGQILFCKKNTDSNKKFTETDLIKMCDFLLFLVDMFYNRHSAFLYVPTVLFLQTCSIIHLKKSTFGNYVDRIYNIELEIKDSTYSDGLLRTKC